MKFFSKLLIMLMFIFTVFSIKPVLAQNTPSVTFKLGVVSENNTMKTSTVMSF